MLNSLLDGWFKMDLGEGAFYSGFGFLFVFVGIVFLICIFTLLGFVMKKINSREKKSGKDSKKTKKNVPATAAPVVEDADEGITPELVAVISAAVAAYLGESQKCDFTVRRIKRL